VLSDSFWRKALLTTVAICAFLLLRQATVSDSRAAAEHAKLRETTALPSPGARLQFSATAYCKGRTTASGVAAQKGIAAADPDLLPVGSVIQIDSQGKYNGIYAIMDTGPKVQGRHIDIYMWSCNEALQFGRRLVRLTVLRLGWNPRASTPGIIDTLFRRREKVQAPVPPPATLPPPLESKPLSPLPAPAEQ
jgi:3D (Asp-Asp-Asp) domain-containing protein